MAGIDYFLSRKKLEEIDKSHHGIKHVAINLADVHFLEKIFKEKGEAAETDIKAALLKRNELVKQCIDLQIKDDVTVLTIFLSYKQDNPAFLPLINSVLAQLFAELNVHQRLKQENMKVTVLGKWYDTTSNLITQIKKVLDTTNQNDSFFLNFCINYDGQEEILDACKVIALKSKLDKLIPNEITEEDLKDNLYVSYFIPPDRIISVNKRRRLLSFLLWDSAYSRIYFVERNWHEINAKELEKYFS